jgi:uncharacterized protein (TIGR02117 family)
MRVPISRVSTKFRRAAAWLLTAILLTPPLYFGLAWMLAYFPANSDFANSGSVAIYVRSNGVHTDLLLPVQMQLNLPTPQIVDWRDDFPPESFPRAAAQSIAKQSQSWIAVGWGDQQFYLDTPRWQDLRLSTALSALTGRNSSLLHVEYLANSELDDYPDMRALYLDASQYLALQNQIQASIDLDDANASSQVIADASYGAQDAFFRAHGHYSALRTCNVWLGDVLRAAGVRMSYWPPFASNVMQSLPPVPKT